jgi:hypothetical protein
MRREFFTCYDCVLTIRLSTNCALRSCDSVCVFCTVVWTLPIVRAAQLKKGYPIS